MISVIEPRDVFRAFGATGVFVFLSGANPNSGSPETFDRYFDLMKKHLPETIRAGGRPGAVEILYAPFCVRVVFDNPDAALNFVMDVRKFHEDLCAPYIVASLVVDGEEEISSSMSDKEVRGYAPSWRTHGEKKC